MKLFRTKRRTFPLRRIKEVRDTQERIEPRILVSWIGLIWPLASVKWGARLAKWIGFDGLQGAPTRGIPINRAIEYLGDVTKILPIVLSEPSWSNGAQPWDPLSRLVFGNQTFAEKRYHALTSLPGVERIVHDPPFPNGVLVEAHPGVERSPFALAALARRQRIPVVVDTYHLRGKDPTKIYWSDDTWKNWHHSLAQLAPSTLVVHFQPLRDGGKELQAWLRGESTELESFVAEIRRSCPYVRYWVVELPLPAGCLKRLIWLFEVPFVHRRVLKKLRQTFSVRQTLFP